MCARVYARGRARVVARRNRDIARDISLRRRSTTSFGLGLDGLSTRPREKRGEEKKKKGKERKGKANEKGRGAGKSGREECERALGAPIKKGSRGCGGSRFRGKVRGEAGCRKLPRQGAACHRESSRPGQAASSAAGIYLAFASLPASLSSPNFLSTEHGQR